MKVILLLFILCCFSYNNVNFPNSLLWETFDNDATVKNWRLGADSPWNGTWEITVAPDNDEYVKKNYTIAGNKWLKMASESPSRYSAIVDLKKPFNFFIENKPLFVHYEIRHFSPQDCGGGYMKLMNNKPKMFTNETDYVIMFGYDYCGGPAKNHFIIKFKDQKTGEVKEHYIPQTFIMKKNPYSDYFRLELYPNDTVILTSSAYRSGDVLVASIATDTKPSMQPPEMIDDPDDKKPDDWVDAETIDDETDVKPDDWDNEPEFLFTTKPSDWREDLLETVPDPNDLPPPEWDEEVDGEYIRQEIDNPECEDISGCNNHTKSLEKFQNYYLC